MEKKRLKIKRLRIQKHVKTEDTVREKIEKKQKNVSVDKGKY